MLSRHILKSSLKMQLKRLFAGRLSEFQALTLNVNFQH